MVGWHHQLNAHGFGWTPGVGDGQGGLECCSSWDCKESDRTEQLNWTELNNRAITVFFIFKVIEWRVIFLSSIQSSHSFIINFFIHSFHKLYSWIHLLHNVLLSIWGKATGSCVNEYNYEIEWKMNIHRFRLFQIFESRKK